MVVVIGAHAFPYLCPATVLSFLSAYPARKKAPGAPGNDVEPSLTLSGVAPPARIVVDQPHPVKVGPDVGVADQELVGAPGQFLPDVA